MQSQRKTQAGLYKGPQDLPSLLNANEWSPTTLFPQPKSLDRIAFPSDRPQPYLDLINRLSGNGHPDLKHLCSELKWQKGKLLAERSRAVVLEYSHPGAPPQQRLFCTSKELEGYLSSSSRTSCNRLYILEDISANYVEALGSQFSIEPSFWAQHLRTTDRETSKTAGIVSALPSIKSLDTSFSLIYPEHTIIDDPVEKFTEEPRIRSAKSLFADCNLYRKITLTRPGEFYDGIAVVNRRASFWSRANPGGSWDGLILADPPIIRMEQEGDTTIQGLIYSHDFLKNKMVSIAISHHAPYQGGYIDFIPVRDTHSNYTGPPRTSLFDDLIYYHNLPNAAPTSLPNPDTAVYFLKKIIAGVWMNSIAYVGTSVSSLEYAVEQSRKHSPSSPPIDGKTTSYGGLEWLEKNLFHIYGWKRRCSQLHDWTYWNLLELDASFSRLKKSSSTDTPTSDIDEQDWLFIKKRLELCETCSRDIVASALGLLSLIESHKSVEEAESARVLALLGTVYLPLSLTAGILSIGGSFTPGQGQFWIFFVVAGPLMVLSLGATYMPIMRDFLSWAMRKGRTEDAGGVKRVPTFVKEGQEPV